MRVDGFAADQGDAARAPVAHDDARNSGVRAQFRARRSRCACDCAGDCAHAAAHETPCALRAHRAACIMMCEHVSGAGIARTRRRADEPVRGKRRLQHGRAHVALDKVRGRTAQRSLHVIGKPLERRFRIVERIGQQRTETRRFAIERLEAGDVIGSERRDLARIRCIVATEEQRSSVIERCKRRRIFAIRIVAVRAQIQVIDDLRVEQTADVRSHGKTVAGPQFFGQRRAAEFWPTLEDDGAQPGACAVRGGNESVVSAADDGDVIGAHRCEVREAVRASRAATDSALARRQPKIVTERMPSRRSSART